MSKIASLLALIIILVSACSTSEIKEAIDVADGIERKPIDYNIVGLNAFANDSRFGTASAQLSEVHSTLGINFIRMLFAWNDQIQASPGAQPNFAFYDSLIEAVPNGVDVLLVLTGIPSWVNQPANWVDGNPRKTFAELWVRKVVERYGANPKVIGFQMWNEPNMSSNPDNLRMDFSEDAENYVELLAFSHSIAKDLAPRKVVLNAATTSINQNFPDTLEYNKDMRDAGAVDFVDVYAVHYYGKQFENVVRDDGVRDFLNDIPRGIWITESGKQGVNEQLAYAEQVWPFLKEKIPSIERIYFYQFTEASAPDVSFGLKNLDATAPVSDLYVNLRDR